MSESRPQLGFHVQWEVMPGTVYDELWDAWIDVLERHRLWCAGGGPVEAQEFVVASDGAQTAERDRERVAAWLGEREDLVRYTIGPIVNLDRVD